MFSAPADTRFSPKRPGLRASDPDTNTQKVSPAETLAGCVSKARFNDRNGALATPGNLKGTSTCSI